MRTHFSVLVTVIGFFFFVVVREARAASFPANRFTLERSEHMSPIVYYFSQPNAFEKRYPILILCDGSDNKEEIRSVLYIRNHEAMDWIRDLSVGFLTVEKWGVDGDLMNEGEFWDHYSRSQRLEDHLKVIQELETRPPEGWNGQFIFVGVSEGGPLVTDLSMICPNVLATINFVGSGDFSWADEFWIFFQNLKQKSFGISFDWDVPSTRREYDALVERIIHNSTSNLWMGGMTYSYHSDAFQKASLDQMRGIRRPLGRGQERGRRSRLLLGIKKGFAALQYTDE